jgi:hypothetical protein
MCWAETGVGGEIPGLKGLSAKEIIFAPIIGVDTVDSVHDTNELLAGAISKLKQAGISKLYQAREATEESETPKVGNRPPLLILTLLATKIDGCNGKMLYRRGLELTEDAVRKRQPGMSVRGVVFGGPLSVEVIESDSEDLERLRRDIDFLLERFFSSLRSAN